MFEINRHLSVGWLEFSVSIQKSIEVGPVEVEIVVFFKTHFKLNCFLSLNLLSTYPSHKHSIDQHPPSFPSVP